MNPISWAEAADFNGFFEPTVRACLLLHFLQEVFGLYDVSNMPMAHRQTVCCPQFQHGGRMQFVNFVVFNDGLLVPSTLEQDIPEN